MITKDMELKRFLRTIVGALFLAFVSSLVVMSGVASATDTNVVAEWYDTKNNPDSFRVTFCQQPMSNATTVSEKIADMQWALTNMADVAVANGTDMIVFSEVAFVTYDCGPRPTLAETVPSTDPNKSPVYYQMTQYAKENNIWIYYGDYVNSSDPDKPYNSGIMIKPDGTLGFVYNKHYGSNSEKKCGTYGGSSYTFDIGHPLGIIGCQICKDFLAGGSEDIKNLDFDFMLGFSAGVGGREGNPWESWMRFIITSSPRKKNGGLWANFAKGGGSFFMDKNGNILENVSGGGNLIKYHDYPLGNIIVDPETRMWLAYNRDSNGDGKKDPCFICGPGDPEGFLYRGTRNANGTRNGDQMALINKMKGTGANSIYLMAIRSHGGDGDNTQNPFVDSDPTKALNGDILNQWETWFTKMDNNDIIIFFFFYDDSARIWDTGDTIGKEERIFIQGLVNKFKHHRNLIWCVAEEYEERYSASRVSNIAAEIRATDDHNHVIAVHKHSGLNFSEFADDPNIDQFAIQWSVPSISANHADMVTAWNNANGRYNLNLAEPDKDYGTVEFSRKRNWAVATGGAYIMPIGWDIASTDDAYLEDCGRLVRFMESTNLNAMAPHDEVVTSGTGYCLANREGEYVIYIPIGGSVAIDLSEATGILDVEWYDPKDGTYYVEGTVTGGGSETFTPPLSGDVVLHISTGTSPPTTTPVITPTPNEAGWNNVTQVVVTFFRADNGTGISYTNYSKTSKTGPWTTVGTSAATGPDAGNVTDISEGNFNVTVLKEGLTEIWYYSVDNTSNIERTKNVTVKIDTTPLLITIHTPENKTYITRIISLNFTTNEPLDTCLLSVDSTPNQTNCKNQAVISREYEAREGTVAWWHFNGDAIDTAGNNNHGTITGASFVAGKFGSALKFDGINDWVSVNDSNSLDTINKTITIEAWIKPVLTGNKSAIFYKESCFGFEITESGNVNFVLCDINASCQMFDSKRTVKNNTWNHAACTSDGTTMRIYINGEQDPITYPAPARIYTSNHSASIGIRQYGESSFDYPFKGDIEELRILNRCLSEEQIKSDYALGEGNHSVTVYGRDTAGNWNSSTVYFNIVVPRPVFDTGSGKYPSISGLHKGTLKPNQTITVYKMYTYPCPGTSGHSEYVRIYNESGTVAKGNWTGYGCDWHNISFDKPFTLKANETYNYTIRTGSYPQIIHKQTANVTGGTITCEEFGDANGRIYYDWIPAFKLYSAEALYQK